MAGSLSRMEARLIEVKLSIIIPILNEAPQLPELFDHLLPMQSAGCEIIFADGGSNDGSATLASVAGFRVVRFTLSPLH